MKALGIIILALIVGFAGYNFAYPKLSEALELASFAPKPAVKEVVVAKVEPVRKLVKSEPAPEAAKPAEVAMAKPEPMAEAPMVATTGGMGDAVKVEAKEGEFVPPTFAPIEDLVKNWTAIPKSAFPRPVSLKKDVEFVMSVGKSKVTAGGTALAIAQEGTTLIVAPTQTSPARAKVDIDETNLKTVLTDVYENWKPAWTAYMKKQFDFKKLAAVREQSGGSGNAKPTVASNVKPVRDADGTFPVLLTSMKQGKVTEITPQNIKKWEDAKLETIDGKEYWTVIVKYTTKTMFGDFDVEAQARLVGGAVEKWVYTGSGEVVP